MSIFVYDRRTGGTYVEDQYGAGQLHFLYETILGRILLEFFVSKAYSRFDAKRNSRPRSAKKIAPFIEQYGIDLNDFEGAPYASFSDFFTRKIKPEKRPVASDPNALVAPADSKLLVYEISTALDVEIKNSVYTIAELLGEDCTEDYAGGMLLVFRLSVDDCHRYIFFDDGEVCGTKIIKGVLHTVTPIAAKRHKVFAENYRVCTAFDTEHFGRATQIEIGALLVGRICNHETSAFRRGMEKGFFGLGGSTIVLLLPKDAAVIDADIIAYSKNGIETKMRLGEQIGRANFRG
ncbi:MAG: phosphatidylserine decarboxylase [Clostridiales Family XIII bacterium]|nr:phosphatidylserine decarboxylase [Clostridiales Family XIII bacterium]